MFFELFPVHREKTGEKLNNSYTSTKLFDAIYSSLWNILFNSLDTFIWHLWYIWKGVRSSDPKSYLMCWLQCK